MEVKCQMSKKPEASKTFISDVHEKGFEGERTFRKYCDEHQIILCNPTNGMSLVIDEINGYSEDWPEFSSSVLDSDPWGQVFIVTSALGSKRESLNREAATRHLSASVTRQLFKITTTRL